MKFFKPKTDATEYIRVEPSFSKRTARAPSIAGILGLKLIIAFSIRFELQEPNAGGYGRECINMGCGSALFEQIRKS